MSKELWCDVYNEKFDECLEQGMTTDQADQESIKWADGYMERLIDQADNLRKRDKKMDLKEQTYLAQIRADFVQDCINDCPSYSSPLFKQSARVKAKVYAITRITLENMQSFDLHNRIGEKV